MWPQKAWIIGSGKGYDFKDFLEYNVNALALENVMLRVHKLCIFHILQVLKKHGKAMDEQDL
jgi:hypothetical protein